MEPAMMFFTLSSERMSVMISLMVVVFFLISNSFSVVVLEIKIPLWADAHRADDFQLVVVEIFGK